MLGAILRKVVEAIVRTLASSTFMSGAAAVASTIVAQQHGVEIPAGLAAAVPIAVGFKEAVRRRAAADLEAKREQLILDRDELEAFRDERRRPRRRRK